MHTFQITTLALASLSNMANAKPLAIGNLAASLTQAAGSLGTDVSKHLPGFGHGIEISKPSATPLPGASFSIGAGGSNCQVTVTGLPDCASGTVTLSNTTACTSMTKDELKPGKLECTSSNGTQTHSSIELINDVKNGTTVFLWKNGHHGRKHGGGALGTGMPGGPMSPLPSVSALAAGASSAVAAAASDVPAGASSAVLGAVSAVSSEAAALGARSASVESAASAAAATPVTTVASASAAGALTTLPASASPTPGGIRCDLAIPVGGSDPCGPIDSSSSSVVGAPPAQSSTAPFSGGRSSNKICSCKMSSASGTTCSDVECVEIPSFSMGGLRKGRPIPERRTYRA